MPVFVCACPRPHTYIAIIVFCFGKQKIRVHWIRPIRWNRLSTAADDLANTVAVHVSAVNNTCRMTQTPARVTAGSQRVQFLPYLAHHLLQNGFEVCS